MKNWYQALLDATSGFFQTTPGTINFFCRKRHSIHWLMLHTKPVEDDQRIS